MSDSWPDRLRGVASPRDRIRVVSLIGQLGRGGSETQLYLLLKHLDPARFERRVVVFSRSGAGDVDEALEREGIPVDTLPESCRGVVQRLAYLRRTFKRLEPDVIHSWTALNNPHAEIAGRLCGARARFGSLRTTLSSSIMRDKRRFHRWLILYGARLLVVNSETCADELVAAGMPRERIRLLRNCVEANGTDGSDDPPADVSDLGIEPHHRLVGLVANLKRVKNPLFFIEAMARVLPEFPDLRVLLVGQPLPNEPDLPGRIEARVAEHALQDRFILTGFRPDVPALLRRMEICCLTSRDEGMPNVLLEAMAAGRPVVATRVGGIPELIGDGDNGFLIEPGDVRGFAAAASRLLRDPELARRMGAAGRRRALTQHSCAEAAERLAAIYQDALAVGRGSRR